VSNLLVTVSQSVALDDTGLRDVLLLPGGGGARLSQLFSSEDVVIVRAESGANWLALMLRPQHHGAWFREALADNSGGRGSGGAPCEPLPQYMRLRLTRVGSIVPLLRMNAGLHACVRGLALLPTLLQPGGEARGAEMGSASRPRWTADFEAWVKATYNQSQQKAIWACAGAVRGVRLLQGPPGTGKTHTVLGVLAALLTRRGASTRGAVIPMPQPGAKTLPSLTPPQPSTPRVLLCAPSNAAVDELVSRISEHGLRSADGGIQQPRLVRIGPLEAMSDASRAVSLEKLVERDIEGSGVSRAELRDRLLVDAQVLASTLSGAGMDALPCAAGGRGLRFDVVVVDEATQATETELLIALKHQCELLILVGDHCQLPPTVISTVAARGGFGRSLFERLLSTGAPHAMLDTQYRMHPAISLMPSRLFYGSSLQDGILPSARPMPLGFRWPRQGVPVALLPTAGSEHQAGASMSNKIEAQAVVQVVLQMRHGGVVPAAIGVVTPYSGQVRRLRSLLQAKSIAAGVEVSTIDGFQGREKEVIIFSTVRANNRGSLGFLADSRRINVAMTRARSGFVVIGNLPTLLRNPAWASWAAWVRREGLEMAEYAPT